MDKYRQKELYKAWDQGHEAGAKGKSFKENPYGECTENTTNISTLAAYRSALATLEKLDGKEVGK